MLSGAARAGSQPFIIWTKPVAGPLARRNPARNDAFRGRARPLPHGPALESGGEGCFGSLPLPEPLSERRPRRAAERFSRAPHNGVEDAS